MELTEDQLFEQHVKHCAHCGQKLLLHYDYDFVCIS